MSDILYVQVAPFAKELCLRSGRLQKLRLRIMPACLSLGKINNSGSLPNLLVLTVPTPLFIYHLVRSRIFFKTIWYLITGFDSLF